MMAYVGLGANLGSRAENLRNAAAQVKASGAVRAKGLRASAIYETEPVGPPQPRYLNAAIAFETPLEPLALLDELLRIENAMGRLRTERWGARLIDLDILLVDDRVVKSARLTVPHALLHERAFALAPLADLGPGLVHPVRKKTVAELLAARPQAERAGVRALAPLDV